jgi:hypothetical protein
MASPTKLQVTVTAHRGSTTVHYRSHGRYISLVTADVHNDMLRQQLFSTVGSKAFWQAVLLLVAADIIAGNGGGT